MYKYGRLNDLVLGMYSHNGYFFNKIKLRNSAFSIYNCSSEGASKSNATSLIKWRRLIVPQNDLFQILKISPLTEMHYPLLKSSIVVSPGICGRHWCTPLPCALLLLYHRPERSHMDFNQESREDGLTHYLSVCSQSLIPPDLYGLSIVTISSQILNFLRSFLEQSTSCFFSCPWSVNGGPNKRIPFSFPNIWSE